MSFDSLLNTTCTIEVKTITQDAAGQKTESWATAEAIVKCRLDAATGGLQVEPDAVYEAATHVIFMREPVTTVTTKDHRIDVAGVKYTILLVRNLYGQLNLNHLELLLERKE